MEYTKAEKIAKFGADEVSMSKKCKKCGMPFGEHLGLECPEKLDKEE